MPPRRKSALEDLIKQGFVADGELLRYKVRRQGAIERPWSAALRLPPQLWHPPAAAS